MIAAASAAPDNSLRLCLNLITPASPIFKNRRNRQYLAASGVCAFSLLVVIIGEATWAGKRNCGVPMTLRGPGEEPVGHHRRIESTRGRSAAIAAMLIGAIAWSAAAHDIPSDVKINAFFKPAGGRLELLIR